MPDKNDKASGEKKKQKPEKKEKKPIQKRGIERFPIAIHVILQLILALVLFGIVNYLSFRHHKRTDLSANKKYTLSPQTEDFLTSIDRPVKVTMSFLNNSVIRDNLKALLERYREASRGQISLDVVDPSRDSNRAAEIADRYKVHLSKNTLIIDVDDRIKTIEESEMLDEGGRFFRGEDAVTSTLIAALEGDPKKVYVVAGKGTMLQFDGRTSIDLLGEISRSHFFEIEYLTLSEIRSIPEDAAALFLPGFSVDLNEREVDMIRDYWNSERGSMVVMIDPASETPMLHDFLAEYGLRARHDRVLEASGLGTKNFEVEGSFLLGSTINRHLQGLTTLFPGITCSLEVGDDEALTKQGIGIIALVQASEQFWGEVNFDDPRPTFDEMIARDKVPSWV